MGAATLNLHASADPIQEVLLQSGKRTVDVIPWRGMRIEDTCVAPETCDGEQLPGAISESDITKLKVGFSERCKLPCG